MSIPYFNKKVFVIDDTAFMRAGLIKILVELGFDKNKIYQFENGSKALEALKLSPSACDLILCDWNMPTMTGIDLLKHVRNLKISNAPFILITTESERDKVVEAIQYNVNGYILKPVSSEKILETIRNVFDIQGDEGE